MTLRNHRHQTHNLWEILQQACKATERQMIGKSSSRSGCRCLQAWQRQQGCNLEAKAMLSSMKQSQCPRQTCSSPQRTRAPALAQGMLNLKSPPGCAMPKSRLMSFRDPY